MLRRMAGVAQRFGVAFPDGAILTFATFFISLDKSIWYRHSSFPAILRNFSELLVYIVHTLSEFSELFIEFLTILQPLGRV